MKRETYDADHESFRESVRGRCRTGRRRIPGHPGSKALVRAENGHDAYPAIKAEAARTVTSGPR